ncbi:hypothetical protein LCGC14_1698630 [marine sediment metagenome]|uniref:DUF1156 domain-containing protein n=1 Tax=marine sediment metagenome TaxID=412755 RepID=A0A0F9HJ76_9ZZZZ
MESDKEHPRVLIEEWFPFREIGIECKRERVGKFIPPNRLHLWWARRPLILSRAALIGSLISKNKKESFYDYINLDRNLKKREIQWNNLKSQGKTQDGIATSRAYLKTLNKTLYDELTEEIREVWNKSDICMLDPMAGGGNIPLESVRLNISTYASDINPISTIINFATFFFPIKFQKSLISKLKICYEEIYKNAKERLNSFFYQKKNQLNETYIWIHTVRCPNPKCNLIVPLSPNWYLSRKKKIILQVIPPISFTDIICKFKIIENATETQIKTNLSTISKGIGICPRCKNTFSGEYIKIEAQSQRMGHQLSTIVYKGLIGSKQRIRKFRTPTVKDLEVIDNIDDFLKVKIKQWDDEGILPSESIIMGEKTRELLNKGIDRWYKLFNSRQLVVIMVLFKEIIKLRDNLLKNPDYEYEEVKAIVTYLQIVFNKIIDYNSSQTRWQSARSLIVNTFDRHDFGFKWSYAEMDLFYPNRGLDWAFNHVLKVYEELTELFKNSMTQSTEKINIYCKKAQSLDYLQNESIDIIIVDPPYYDNVMYAELSDFFYVWAKRGIGIFYPDIFKMDLTDKDNEAVANASRFEGLGTSKKSLAKKDYEAKMRACFEEMSRVLTPNGIMNLMFTHKSTDAWDTLTMSLMEAGFEITASWPVHTEQESSLHIAKKNSVKTTILLVCRKRLNTQKELWWEDDILPAIKKVVSKKAKKFRQLGVDGSDLFISCFGPALKEFSKSYPVKNIAGDQVRAEKAIEIARKVVVDITLQDIIKGKSYNIDSVSKFYLTAWYFFKARIFPFDEARRLALSIGINIDELKTSYKLLDKKGGDVELFLPKEREKRGVINVSNPKDNGILINAVHISLMAYEEGGQKAYENVIEKLRRNTDKSFRLYMETLFNVLPDIKDLSKNLPEKKILGEILMVTEEKITPKGGKITDFIE